MFILILVVSMHKGNIMKLVLRNVNVCCLAFISSFRLVRVAHFFSSSVGCVCLLCLYSFGVFRPLIPVYHFCLYSFGVFHPLIPVYHFCLYSFGVFHPLIPVYHFCLYSFGVFRPLIPVYHFCLYSFGVFRPLIPVYHFVCIRSVFFIR